MKTLSDVHQRDGHGLKQYCIHNPKCKDWHETGDHVVVKTDKGWAVFPDRDMGKGLWCKVVKQIVAIGLGCLMIGLILKGLL